MKVVGKLCHWGSVCGLWVGVLLLVGCQTGPDETFAELPPVPAAPAGTPSTAYTGAPAASNAVAPAPGQPATPNNNSPEIIKVGDLLTVSILDIPIPQQATLVKVREDGTITLLLNLPFVAAGKTSGELEREIRAAYVPRYFVNMTVTVMMQNGFYFVDGEVKTPNRFPYQGKTTVTKAIASAGDFTDFANKRKVKLIRTDGRVLVIDCIKALSDPSLDLEVYPNDKIHVPRRII
jgi:protein involved in polysaccharide export with SLBB domain